MGVHRCSARPLRRVRVAMSGRRMSPPLFESMEIVGRDITLARLKGLREHL